MDSLKRVSQTSTEGDGGLDTFFRQHGAELRFAPAAAIEVQGQPVSTVYRIRRGCVRSCIYTEEGERKILQFLVPGDYLGVTGCREWSVSEEAVDMVVVDAVSQAAFEAAVHRSTALQDEVRHYLSDQLDAHAELLVLTAQTTAVERVRAFLRNFAANRRSGGFVSLPMGRRDIADHLGLSMETVSRSISTLKAGGEIALNGASFFRFLDTADARDQMPHAA